LSGLIATQILAGLPMATAHANGDSPREVAERIRNHAERYERAGNDHGAREAREAANRAERAGTERAAREIERNFNRGN
jgi:hypothetical protein